ncbi:MAG: lytic transglycosylase domain-containing protein [Pseudomonadota bacterium]
MRWCATLIVAALLGQSVAAQDSDPNLVRAIELADQGDYPAAYAEIADSNATAESLITWWQLRDGQGSFDDYLSFLDTHPGWPARNRLRAKAEEAIPTGYDPFIVASFFAANAPQTGAGAVRYAEALIALDQVDAAHEELVAAWSNMRLSEDGQTLMLENFGEVLAPHHLARADAQLWRWRTGEAAAMVPLLTEDEAALVTARIAYITNSGVAEAAAAVPPDLQQTPALLYDRYNWLAGQGNRSQAVALVKAQSTSVEALQHPFRWSGWRRSLARWEMREGRPESAYEVASQHFLTEGSAYADLEWVAGYIAFRYLDDAALALTHFQRIAAAVDSPISVGRAWYWIGRTHAALGDATAASAAFAKGAEHQTSFYGLLSAEQLGMRLDPALTGQADIVDWEDSDILDDPLVVSALALLEAGERGAATQFFSELGRTLDAADTGRLAKLMEDLDDPYYSVLLGKAAVERGIIVPSAYFPLHDLAEMELPADPELSLAIARRESEFNFRAGSPVGALGLMQLMPATAEEVAGFLELPYSRGRLTSDWRYNAQLGAKYLAVLEEQFGPSPVQIAAGYNAGPSRPELWMDDRGDPRLGEVDVIDWIEHIPFRETRNYVMRVTESIPVYQARLTGRTGRVAFTSLLLGEKPLNRPALRPIEFPPEIVDEPPLVLEQADGPRPVARPLN